MKIAACIFHRLFDKDYKKQNPEVKKAFREKIHLLVLDSAYLGLNNHPLHGKRKGYWSINVTGDIRAVYKVEKNIAIFVAIGSHSELYK